MSKPLKHERNKRTGRLTVNASIAVPIEPDAEPAIERADVPVYQLAAITLQFKVNMSLEDPNNEQDGEKDEEGCAEGRGFPGDVLGVMHDRMSILDFKKPGHVSFFPLSIKQILMRNTAHAEKGERGPLETICRVFGKVTDNAIQA